MSLREEQCQKVCRILDDVLANRPTERDALIVATRRAFDALAEPKMGKWIEEPNCCFRCSICGEHYPSIRGYMKYRFCPNCGAKMEVTE